MSRAVLFFQVSTVLAVLGLATPSMAGDPRPSASSTDNDPVFAPEGTTTTTSVGNADGSRTVTTTDADGNVVGQHTVPGPPAPGPVPPHEVDPAGEDPAGADAAGPRGPSGPPAQGGRTSAVPPPINDWQRADDELIDMEEQIRDLRYEHNELLDRAGVTEDPEAFQDLVGRAQRVFDELNDLQDAYGDRRAEAARLVEEPMEPIDMGAMGAELERLEEQIAELHGATERAETDEEAEALEAEASQAEARLRLLQEQYDQIVDEVHQGAVQRAQERQNRATGHQGAMQRHPTPTTQPMNPMHPMP